jgi:hypothetical protein
MHQAAGVSEVRVDGNGVKEGQLEQLSELLTRVEHKLNGLMQGLSLLGVKRCSWCERFFRASDPGTMFSGGGELVCFGCIPAWWSARREDLGCEERKNLETDLVFWLRGFHNARLVKGSRPTEKRPVRFELVANCLECRGSGALLGGRRCRYCDGPGVVRVVVHENSR